MSQKLAFGRVQSPGVETTDKGGSINSIQPPLSVAQPRELSIPSKGQLLTHFGYRIEFIDETAVEEFSALPKAVQKALHRAITSRLEVDPVSYGKPLRYSLKGHRRLRVGSYRIVYRIDDPRKTVIIVATDHRKDIYDE